MKKCKECKWFKYNWKYLLNDIRTKYYCAKKDRDCKSDYPNACKWYIRKRWKVGRPK